MKVIMGAKSDGMFLPGRMLTGKFFAVLLATNRTHTGKIKVLLNFRSPRIYS